MKENYQIVIARIYNQNDIIIGAGFLISPHRLLTCAHVVIKALGIEKTTKIPQAPIKFDFCQYPSLTAKIVFWQPCSSSKIENAQYGEDIAVLEIIEPRSSNEIVPNLLSIETNNEKCINIYGFPEIYNGGIWITSEFQGLTPKGWLQMNQIKLSDHIIERGFSGAPVWDKDKKTIIGMVTASDLGDQENKTATAFAISSSVLIDTCLKFLELQDILLELDLKTVKKAYTDCRQRDSDKPIPETIQEMITSFADEAKFNLSKENLNLFIQHLIISLNETKSNKYDSVIKWGKKYIKDLDESLNQKIVVKNVDDYMNGVVVYDDLQNPSSTDGYVEHFNAETQAKNLDTIETKCKKQIEKGNFIRIKGSSGMGKSELLKQLVNYCQSKNYLTIKIDFRAIEKSIFNDLKSFSTLFSNLVMREIITLNNLNEDQFIDYKTNFNPDSVHYSTTKYFKNQILTFINNQNKLILAMDNVDKLFTSEINDDICSLWRSWNDSTLFRQKMVMIITHSTDDYPDYNINSSPLRGIGYVPVLTDWEQPQIKQICQQYQLQLSDSEIEKLISKIGGHPYLIRLAINYLHEKQTTVERLLEIKLQEKSSPFCNYLDQILQHLQSLPNLCQIYAKILDSETITLNHIDDKFYLTSMGLIKYNNNGEQILPKYPIYKDYFLPLIQEVI